MQALGTLAEGGNTIMRAPPLEWELIKWPDITDVNWANLTEDNNDSDMETDTEMHEEAITKKSEKTIYVKDVFSKKLKVVCSLIESLPSVTPPIRRSAPDSYADTPLHTRSPTSGY